MINYRNKKGQFTGGYHPPTEFKKGMIPWSKGKHLSEEHKKKLSLAKIGKKLSKEHKKRLSDSHKGKICSEETRKKISLANKGHIVSEEARRKMSLSRMGITPWMKGKHHTVEAKRKITQSNLNNPRRYWLGKHLCKETREKISSKLKGKSLPEEVRKKVSYALKNLNNRLEVNEKLRKAFTGNKNPQWMDGRSYEPYSPDFNNYLRNKVKKRDNYCCQLCGMQIKESRRIKINPNKNWLIVHHINHNKKDNNISNLITLCNHCHARVHINDKSLSFTNFWINFFNKIVVTNKVMEE